MAYWMTVKEAAEVLNISRRQVINRIQNGQLKAKRDGRIWLIHESLSVAEEEGEEVPKGYSKEEYEKLEEMVEVIPGVIKVSSMVGGYWQKRNVYEKSNEADMTVELDVKDKRPLSTKAVVTKIQKQLKNG